MAGKGIKGSKSHDNLKEAFAGESQANRRYLYFARVADIEGFPDVAGLFRDTADGETGHAHGHLDYLKQVGDPATGEPIGSISTHVRPGSNLIGFPAASAYWAGCSFAGRVQWPLTIFPSVNTHASPWPTVWPSAVGLPAPPS